MSVTLSSGLKWRWMENYGLRAMLYGGVIVLYDGDRPSSPDYAPSGRRLAAVTQNGDVFTPGSMADGALQIQQPLTGIIRAYPSAASWKLTGELSGRATWFRYYGNSADSLADDFSGDYVRMDADVSGSSGVLILANTLITPSEVRSVDDFLLTFAY